MDQFLYSTVCILFNNRNLGFGKVTTEQMIVEEVQELCSGLEATGRRPIDIRHKFNIAILNSLWSIMSGERLDHKDEKLSKFVQLSDKTLKELANPIGYLTLLYKPISWVNK